MLSLALPEKERSNAFFIDHYLSFDKIFAGRKYAPMETTSSSLSPGQTPEKQAGHASVSCSLFSTLALACVARQVLWCSCQSEMLGDMRWRIVAMPMFLNGEREEGKTVQTPT
jgi:hypothetical protein